MFVTPIKVDRQPRQLASPQPNKSTFIEAAVLDEQPASVTDIALLRQTIAQMIQGQGGRPALNGTRGFMIRYGFSAPDGSTSSSGFEFYQRKAETPNDTIERFLSEPANGAKLNLFKGLLIAVKETLKRPNGFVHVCGLTKARVNDYGLDDNNHRLAPVAKLQNDYQR